MSKKAKKGVWIALFLGILLAATLLLAREAGRRDAAGTVTYRRIWPHWSGHGPEGITSKGWTQ